MKDSRVGFFGPGVGALVLLRGLLESGWNRPALCYSDKRNSPYSLRSAEDIVGLIDRGIDELTVRNAQAIVFGCNTSSLYLDDVQILRAREGRTTPRCISLLPITVAALNKTEEKESILLLGSPALCERRYYSREMMRVFGRAEFHEVTLPGASAYLDSHQDISDSFTQRLETDLKAALLEHSPQLIISVCTHFDLLVDRIGDIAAKVLGSRVPVLPQGRCVLQEIEGALRSTESLEQYSHDLEEHLVALEVLTNDKSPAYRGRVRALLPKAALSYL